MSENSIVTVPVGNSAITTSLTQDTADVDNDILAAARQAAVVPVVTLHHDGPTC